MTQQEKESNNQFRFSVYQEKVTLCDRIFDVDMISPVARYSVDIRSILPIIINKFQKLFSKKELELMVGCGCAEFDYDIYDPQPVVQQFEGRTIKGVECKIGLYVNDKPIVERVFYVDGFNPMSRWSLDLINTTVEATNIIFKKIKDNDIKNMFDDYDLMNIRGLTATQIGELTPQKRNELLWKIKNN